MPLTIPVLDDRKYQELLDEALARIPVHNPEWTNFDKADPGVTVIEVFAFLTENLLYRSNQIPERNRRKFLSLLGVPLQPASSAMGLVTFTNERGPQRTITLTPGVEVRAGQVPFRTERGLDVLPVEGQVYYKRKVSNPPQALIDYYKQLYASFKGTQVTDPTPLLYETVPLNPRGVASVDLGEETVDGSLWIALIVRASDKASGDDPFGASIAAARDMLAGKTLNLGIVPALADASRRLAPGGQAFPEGVPLLQYFLPSVPAGGELPASPAERTARYRALDATASSDVLAGPGVVEITLPSDPSAFELWSNLEPLESGAGNFPPALDDSNANARIITWLRISSSAAVRARLLWVGINAVFVRQRAHISNELLPAGTGEPDQAVTLSRTPVVPASVRLSVTVNGKAEAWSEVDDLTAAGPEVRVPDPRRPPGAPAEQATSPNVFVVDPEAGTIRFGDGARGRRPPFGATLRADYDYGVGRAGNVGAGSINTSPSLPAGLKVGNPVRTWGGAEAETASDGEKHIARFLQHRDRLVSAADFETIASRTPGVDVGRIEVIPAFNPELGGNQPGDAAGAVTLMAIPRYDPLQPDAPQPDRLFLDAICSYLDPRRLVTTEVFLRGPIYKGIWVSVGIQVVAGLELPPVREAVKQALLQFLAPLARTALGTQREASASASAPAVPSYPGMEKGWPLRKAVVALELLAVASRVPGILLINSVLIAEGTRPSGDRIPMNGLELPRVLGISVVAGEPLPIDQLRDSSGSGTATGAPGTGGTGVYVPVPIVPEEC